ncbi:TonB-dependent receptor [Roseivirga pacifica]|uniref:TonB-dependent receptor n=1 Tax=Roseivirga pacifica TaxID=1267423 RepID=UPI00227A89DA|nr:TonB-dependent receptor [Roseivirga pacifica]
MKKLFLLCLLMGGVCIAQAQIITIKDQQTDEPLELATIQSDSPRAFVVTNAKGNADISVFEGATNIQVRMLGYETKSLSFADLQSGDFKLQMLASSVSLDNVVVSATKWNQNSYEVPTKITSIAPRDIALQNPQTAADLLTVSGKVFMQKSQQGGGSPMIRGFATNRLLYSIDGVRMNTAIFRAGNIQNVISLDPFAIEHTEVLFGPGSVIYGSDAIGGVMSFKTITPQLSLTDKPVVSGNVFGRYSSANNEKTGHFDINVGWKKWAFATSISANDYDHLKQGSNGPDDYLMPYYVERRGDADVVIENDDPRVQIPSGYDQYNITQKVRFQPNKHWDFQYGFHYSETSEYGRYDRHNRMRNDLPRYGEWSYGPQKWMMNNLNITHTAQTGMFDEVVLRLAQQSFEESRMDRSLNSAERAVRVEEVEAYSVNLDFTKNLAARHTFYYGLEVVTNDVTSTGTDEDIVAGTSVPGPSRYPQAVWNSYALYATDQYRASEQLTFQAGLRYNLYSLDAEFDTSFYPFPFSEAESDNAALTGSLGAVYRPSQEWVFSTNLSTGFRAPNVDDMGKVFDSEPGAVVVPNPDLDAEYAYNIDLSVAKVFGDMLKIDVTGYHTWLENAMVRRDYTLNGQTEIMYDGEMSRVQAIQNAAIAKVYGLQFGLELKLPAGFSFTTDYNFQHGEEELDDGATSPSRHAAPSFGVSRLNFKQSKLTLQLYANYQSEASSDDLPESEKGKTEIYALDGNGNAYAPSWYTLNLKGQYLVAPYLTVGAGIENITDQRYRPYSSGISGAGRNFIVSVKATF